MSHCTVWPGKLAFLAVQVYSPLHAPLFASSLTPHHRKRFYGENELYQHMHSAHEQCFLCRRADPNKYVYYRDYAGLEGEQAVCVCVCARVCARVGFLSVLRGLGRVRPWV